MHVSRRTGGDTVLILMRQGLAARSRLRPPAADRGSTTIATRSSPIRVSTSVALFGPLPEPVNRALRSSSGVTDVPRFLISSVPIRLALTHALSFLTLYGLTSSTLYARAKG